MPSPDRQTPAQTSLFTLFWVFFRIGLLTIGGGYVMLSFIKREIVDRHAWLDEETYLDGITAAQSCPGPIAVNMSVYSGYHIRGWQGAALAVLGTVLPSFIVILLIAVTFQDWAHQPVVQKVFRGLRPAVTALIAVPIIQMAQSQKLRLVRYWLPLVAVILIVVYQVSPIWLIALTILGAWWKLLFDRLRNKPGQP